MSLFSNMKFDSEFHQLLLRLCSGELNETEERSLMARIEQDSLFRDQYVVYMASLHAELIWHFDKQSETLVSGQERLPTTCNYLEFSDGPTAAVPNGAKKGWWKTTGPVVTSTFIVAALFYGIFVGIAWDLHPSKSRRRPAQSPIAKRHVVAELTAARDCEWGGAQSPTVGAELSSDELILNSGLAELTIDNGTKLVFQGPARFEPRDKSGVYLAAGRLAVYVPPRAVGFAVETPTARVVDLGTEFRLEASSTETKLAVTVGKVDLIPVNIVGKNGERSPGPPRRVIAGEAVAIAAQANGAATVKGEKFDNEWLSVPAATLPQHRSVSPVVAYQLLETSAGNRMDFHGGVGLDFDVRVPIRVLSLGVFDHLGDGIDPATSPIVQLWSRNMNGTPDDPSDDIGREVLETQRFTALDADELKFGHRFKPLDNPIDLPIGSYSIVAYGLAETNAFIAFEKADDNVPNLKGHWTFDGTLADAVGSNNGTFNGGKPAYVTGKIGQAIKFDGLDDHFETPHNSDPDSLTITAWIKPSDVTLVNIMARGSANINQGSNMLRINGNSKFEHWIYATDGNHTVTGTTTVKAETWYHVAVVASNDGMMRLYVNGVEEGTAQRIATMWDADDRLRVGVSNAMYVLGYYDGLVDDLRIYDRALSSSQIKAIYKELSLTNGSKVSDVRRKVETWLGSIVPVGSRFGEGEPGRFPVTFRDRGVSYGAGSFEYSSQRSQQ